MNRSIRNIFLLLFLTSGFIGSKAQTGTESNNTESSVTDIDGNIYKTVMIGNQLWLSENLKTTKYNNGDIIETTSIVAGNISEIIKPRFQWIYEGNSEYLNLHGRLYTWEVVNDSRGVCPSGWHVPDNTEWLKAMIALGGEIAAKNKKKEIDSSHFVCSNMGAQSLFAGHLSGKRSPIGLYLSINQQGYWWSSSEENLFQGYCIMGILTAGLLGDASKLEGLSIRCTKDK